MVKTSAPPKKKAAYTTTVFMKRLMAWSGIIFIVYLLFHAYGNTHYLQGEIAYDHYAVWLRSLLEPLLPYEGVLWILRVVLTVLILAHVVSALYLWLRNRKARGNDKYEVKKANAEYFASRYAMRTMRWGGIALALFIIWHLLQFTTLTLTPGGEYIHGRAYSNMYYGFQLWWVYLIYVVALACLCLHVWHGVWSALQTLGATRGNTVPFVRLIAFIVAFGLFFVFMIVPTAILFGWVDAPMAAAEYYPQFCDAIGSSAEQFAECAAH